jgi:optic atrophy protein 1
MTTIRNNLLQRNSIEVDNEFIREVWFPVYRRHFLKQSLAKAYDCRKSFYLYHQQADVDCSDIVLFHRIQQMMKVTANALRQQITNREGIFNCFYFCCKKNIIVTVFAARRLDKEIKEVLEDYSQDIEKKEKLLTGRRVTLAEELSKYIVLVYKDEPAMKYVQ